MRTIFITVTSVVLCIFATIVESSTSRMYVNSMSGVIEYTNFDASTRTVIASGLGTARGIDVDSHGNLYAGYMNGNIYKFNRNSDGTIDTNYSLYATGASWLHSLTFDSNDNLYSTDYSSGKVYILNSSWTPGSAITGATPYIQAAAGVHGVAFDSLGYIYINTYTGPTSKYTSTGTLLGTYTTIPSASTVVWQGSLYTVLKSDIYKVPLVTDASTPGYTTTSPGVVHFISGLNKGEPDFEVDDNNDLYISSYENNLIYHYDKYGNPVGDGIFDSGITNPHYMTLWIEQPTIPEPATLILMGLSFVAIIRKKSK